MANNLLSRLTRRAAAQSWMSRKTNSENIKICTKNKLYFTLVFADCQYGWLANVARCILDAFSEKAEQTFLAKFLI